MRLIWATLSPSLFFTSKSLPEFVVAALVVGLTVVVGLVVALAVVALAGHTPPPHQHLPSPHSQQERASQAALVSLDPSQITSPASSG